MAKKKASVKKMPGKVTGKKPASKRADTKSRKVDAEIFRPGNSEDSEGASDLAGTEFEDEFSPEFAPEILEGTTEPDEFDEDAALVVPEILSPRSGKQDDEETEKPEKGLSNVDPVATYLAEIRKYPILTREQEHDLAVRYREQADAKAAETLVTANLRFVVKIAAEYSKFGARLIDLIQEGNVGLMHAVKEFNPYKGTKLITYAVWWIRGYIQEYLMRQYSMVRIGTTQNQRKLFYRLQKERELLEQIGKTHDYAMLGTRLGVSPEEVETMTKRLSGRDVSLNQPLDSDSGASLLDFESSDEAGADEQLGHAEELSLLRKNIEKIRHDLNEKEAYILEHRLLSDEPLTLQEIGDHFGVTREAVRQVEVRLMNRIKTVFERA